MSAIEQIRVIVDDQWQVSILLPDGSALPVRTLLRAKHPDKIAPKDEREMPAVLPWPPETPPQDAEIRLLAARCQRLVRRQPRSDPTADDYDTKTVGRHLFAALFGGGVWEKILEATPKASVLELALQWSGNQRELHRLNWEMMHGPKGFLAAGFSNAETRLVRVAISRVVAEGNPPRANPPLPRILFVVGSSLNDPRIRAGAEFFGLLRRLEAKQYGSTFVTRRNLPIRLLLEANAETLTSTVKEFQPDIVHVIAHGSVEGAKPALLFRPSAGEQEEQRLQAKDLINALTVDAPGDALHGFRPNVLILAACFSGTAPAAPVVGAAAATEPVRARLDGPWQGGPLAAELVALGIPVVIGMAGEVADQSCRLFTRTFGEALISGASFLVAMECGRRAAFTLRNESERTVDWALPALYRAKEVPPTFAVIAAKPTAEEIRIDDALGQLRIERDREPVMAARFELQSEHYRRLRDGDKGTLLLMGPSGCGKSRLLRELAVQTARDGHLPLLITTEPEDSKSFSSAAAVAETWTHAVEDLCVAFQLKPPNPIRVRTAGDRAGGGTMRALFLALREDLAELIVQAKAAFPQVHRGDTKAWVLLDHLELYEPSLQPGFFFKDPVLSSFGLGTGRQSVIPFVATVNLEAPSAQAFKLLVEKRLPGWMDWKSLGCFSTAGEEHLLAYSHVLLQPHTDEFKDSMEQELSGVSWYFNPVVPLADRQRTLAKLQKRCSLLPQDFITKEFYQWVEDARDSEVLIRATDEELLKNLLR